MEYKNKFSIVVTAFLLSVFLNSCKDETTHYEDTSYQVTNENPEDEIARGAYLVGIIGCNDCHSPKRMGEKGPEIIPELLLSGYPSDRPIVKFDSELIKEGFPMFYPDLTATVGPWGISFAGNLTPHETGIGTWTENQFITAMTKGKHKGLENGRMLLPPMPWPSYANMSKEDLRAMFKYLKSITPVDNVVPSPVSPEAI